MGERAYRLWPMVSAVEAPAYMSHMEERGLRFEKLLWCGFLVCFRKTEPKRVRYCWDYFEPEVDGTAQQERLVMEYLAVCERTGWEIAWQFENVKVFRAMDGVSDPVPIQSDEELRLAAQKKAAKKGGFSAALVFLVLFGYICFKCLLARDAVFVTGDLERQLIVLSGLCLLFFSFIRGLISAGRLYFSKPGVEISFSRTRITAAYLEATAWVLILLLALSTAEVSKIEDLSELLLVGLAIPAFLFSAMIGAWLRRQLMGIGRDAQKRGMKGIVYSDWKIVAAGVLTALLLTGAAIVVSSYLPHLRPDRGGNLYCEEIREEGQGGLLFKSAYYLAKTEAGAKKIVEEYRDVQSSWIRRRMEEESGLTAQRLRDAGETVGGHPVPEGPWDGVWSGSFGTLIRKGREVWFVSDI